MPITRREWITRVGAAGGIGAAQLVMRGLGITPAHAQTTLPRLPAGSGKGKSVVILGAGMAGMAAAHELGKAGYACTILEARERVGGKNWTVRGGDTVTFADGRTQTCRFDEGQYFNAGAGRIPSHHSALLGYCREFSVALEVEVNSNHNAAIQNDAANGGHPIQLRQAFNDTRGFVSELLAKAINQHALDAELTAHDQERMIAFLTQYGDLRPDLSYGGSSRSGYTSLPGAADDAGTVAPPISLRTMLDADMWHSVMFDEILVMQSTMLQPVNGMDQIARAFHRQLGDVVRTQAEVTHIGRAGQGVNITYRDRRTNTPQAVSADFCICTIPLAVLSSIPSDFFCGCRPLCKSFLTHIDV
ncbi:FAD-dependent oxidoreductase [Komagataeibacter xylinus]|uniref:Tryptophan 2-monooxygenase n=1 Tax=Komagataeibacter xylinus TaxID=28448 RepID=A0A857FM04_KOMXY|nr:FAD-dependent oxidoreductase [Komagataeibacter xylinus]QHC35303.1 FAD-binding protein [Komagataeibacter xylinus]